MAEQFVAQTDPYSIPQGWTTTTTPGGVGTAYKDTGGNVYTRNASGFQLYNSPTTSSTGYVPSAVVTSEPARTQTTSNQAYQQTQATAPPPTPNAPLPISSANTQLQGIIDQTNQLLAQAQQGGFLTPELQKQAAQITGFNANIQTAGAKAQDALTQKNYGAYDQYIQQMKQLQQQQTDMLTKYYQDIQPLREQYLSSLNPSPETLDIQKQLSEATKGRRDFELNVQQSAQNQFGLGRPLAVSTGRANKLIQQNQNTVTNMRNSEADLLMSLGFQQEADQLRSRGLETALGFAQSDLEIRQKMADRLMEQEQGFLDYAMKLDAIQRDNLAKGLDFIQANGINVSKLSPQEQAKIASIGSQYGIEPSAFLAMAQHVFDIEEAKRLNTLRPSGTDEPGGTTQTKTFEQFIQDKQNQMGASIVNKEAYRSEYERLYGQQAQTGKPATVAQSSAAGFATRMKSAEDTFAQVTKDIVSMSYPTFKAQMLLPSAYQSSLIQTYDQSARNFVNAVLRRESGAAISQSEFDNAYKQYIPQPGDSEATLRQKAQNRADVYNNLVKQAGTAYQSSLPPGTIITNNGIRYVVGADGETLQEL